MVLNFLEFFINLQANVQENVVASDVVSNQEVNNSNFQLVLSIPGLRTIGAGLAVLGMSGAGIGIGLVFFGLLTGTARRPEVKKDLFVYALLGFALTESIALFCLSLTFVILNSVA